MSKLCKSLLAVLTVSNIVLADEQLQLSHELISSQQNGTYQTVSLSLRINNPGSQDLHRVKLSPSGSEFASVDQDKPINIGYLPAMGQAVVEWRVNTPLAVEYFHSGMPLFFIIKAKQNNGEDIEFPVYSHGGMDL